VTGKGGRRRKLIPNDLAEAICHWKLKEEAPDCTLWRTDFEIGCAPVARQTMQ
jgi:hypothetical protein